MLWAQVSLAAVPATVPLAFDVPIEATLSPAAVLLADELRTELVASGTELIPTAAASCHLELREASPSWVQLTLRLGETVVAERRLALEDSARMRLGAWLLPVFPTSPS